MKLGYSNEADVKTAPVSKEGIKASEGFTAGKHIEKSRKWFWQ